MLEKLEINNTCISCDACLQNCPENAVITDGTNFAVDPWSCTLCGICLQVCPVDCIKSVKNSRLNHSK